MDYESLWAQSGKAGWLGGEIHFIQSQAVCYTQVSDPAAWAA